MYLLFRREGASLDLPLDVFSGISLLLKLEVICESCRSAWISLLLADESDCDSGSSTGLQQHTNSKQPTTKMKKIAISKIAK